MNIDYFSKEYIHEDYKTRLKAKALGWFIFIITLMVVSLFVLSFSQVKTINNSTGAMIVHIGLFLLSALFLKIKKINISILILTFLSPTVQVIRIFMDNYTHFYGMLGSVSFFYFFLCIGFAFLPVKKAILSGILSIAFTFSSLLFKGVYAGMSPVLMILFMFPPILIFTLVLIMAMIESKVFIKTQEQSNIIERNNDNLNELVTTLKNLITKLADSSREIATSSEYFAQSTQEESASIEEITSTMEELSANAENILNGVMTQNDKIKHIIEQIKLVHGIVNKAGDKMQNTMSIKTAMDMVIQKTKELLTNSRESIKDTQNYFKKVSSSIDVITNIADQTNLLALNAQIESARAGEAGRGFAVVADEINKLADETQHNAREILSYISNLSENITRVAHDIDTVFDSTISMIEKIHDFGRGVEEVGELAKQDIEINQDISTYTSSIVDIINFVQAAINEQQIAIEEVAKSITDMNQTVQTNAGTAEELASSADSLNDMVEELKDKTI